MKVLLTGLLALTSAWSVFAAGVSEGADASSNDVSFHETPPETSEQFWNDGDFSTLSGTTIRYITRGLDAYEQGVLDEFTALTGISVAYEEYSYADLKNKVLLELLAGGRAIDLFQMQPFLEGIRYSSGGFLAPLNDFIEDRAITDPDWDYEDFLPGARNMSVFDSKVTGIPLFLGGNLFFYRTDLLDAAGVSVPQTFAEFMDAASKLAADTDGDGSWDVFGVAMRAEFNLAHVSSWLFAYGGGFFDDDGNVIINSPASVRAVTDYVTTLNSYGPPGVIGYEDTLAAFTGGRAAMFIGPAGRVTQFVNPEASDISGRFGVTVVPEGPAGIRAPLGDGYHIGMSHGSQNQVAAWLAMQYMTRKEVMDKKQRDGVPSPRASSWDNAASFLPASLLEWADAFKASAELASGVTHVPAAIKGLEMRYAIEAQIIQAIEGTVTVQTALDNAAAEISAMVEDGDFQQR